MPAVPPDDLIPHPARRCRRGPRCPRAERFTWRPGIADLCSCTCHLGGAFASCSVFGGCADAHPDIEEQHVMAGVLLEHPSDGLCEACRGRLGLVLDELPELYVRLHLAHLPTLATRYRHDDITGNADPHPAIPLNAHADAIARALDHELSTWADHVADACRLQWSADAARRSRDGDRVQRAVALLARLIPEWLALDVHSYPARSTAVRRTHGHDPDTTHMAAGEAWCEADGPTSALRVMRLHSDSVNLAGLRPQDDMPGPCWYCSHRTLRRDHATCIVRCRTCGATATDDGYDTFVKAMLDAHTQDQAAAQLIGSAA